MEDLVQEIRRLKEELDQKKREIDDLKKLTSKEIDREFPARVEEISERELETYFRDCFPPINAQVESKPDIRAITSHRRVLRKPIVFLKRAFLETTFRCLDSFLDKQVQFNRQIATLGQALLLRVRYNIDRLKKLEEKVSGCEEDLAILKNKLEELRSSAERLRSRPTDQPLK